MSTKTSRESFLDLLRILASFLVIVNHTNSTIFLHSTPDSAIWYLSLIYFFVSKIAVPVFLMISGYLLLDKVDTWKKALSRVFRIFVVLFSCAIIYSLYHNIYEESITSPAVIIKTILQFYQKTPSNAFWYLYVYIGLLLMLPFLQKMVQNMSRRDYHVFFIVSGGIYSVWPIFVHYFGALKYSNYFQFPLFTTYICMLLIGSYFKRFGLEKTKRGFWMAFVIFVSMVALNVVLTRFEYAKSGSGYLFFDDIKLLPIILESACCFYMCTFVKFRPKLSKFVTYIGSCTFGIYLISDMVISFTRPAYLSLCGYIHPFIAVLLFEAWVFLSGLLITMILKKVPVVKKYL